MRGLQATRKQGKRGKSSVQKRKIHAKRRKREEKGCILRATTGMREKKEAKRIQNDKKLSRNHQNHPKIMKNHENGSERSPRDKSGAFGFENMFWPLVFVARPDGVTGGVQGWGPGCVCAYGDRGACVCPVYVCIRSLHVHMSRPYHLFISIAPINRNAKWSQVKGIRGHQQAKGRHKILINH